MSYLITRKKRIAEDEFDIWIKAPLIASNSEAGQFVVLRSEDGAERIPLTIADSDPENGEIRIIYQVVGTSTMKLSKFDEGDHILNVAGPLGKPSEIPESKKTVVIGGGVGIAAILPIVKALHNSKNNVITIIGARTSEYLILKDELKKYSDELLLSTNDGSEGYKGFVTDILKDRLKSGHKIDYAWAVGPTIMMKAVSEVAIENDFPVWTSLNPIMIDGTGMCGGCRVKVKDEVKFACVDGPEFDGRYVDWINLINRQKQFVHEEEESFHKCNLSEY